MNPFSFRFPGRRLLRRPFRCQVPGSAGKPPGFSVIELLIAIILGGFVIATALTAFVMQFRAAERILGGVDGTLVASFAWSVVSTEIRAGPDSADQHHVGGDSVRVRAFRGSAWRCPDDAVGTVRVTYTGDRSPNPAKDSVLVLTDGGRWVAQALVDVGGGSVCPSTGRPVRRWTLSGAVPSSTFMRLFESGSYSLSSGSLRYRIGRGGRQPLTAARFDSAAALRGPGGGLPGGVHMVLPIASTPFSPADPGGGRTAWKRGERP